MFDVKSKVVCIDDSFPKEMLNYLRNFPVKGKVYTVRDIIPAQDAKGNHTVAVLLDEVRNVPAPHRKQWGECGFAPSRFREVEQDEMEEKRVYRKKRVKYENV